MNKEFPQKGKTPSKLLENLQAMKQADIPWKEGKVFAYLYDPGEEAAQLLRDAYSMYLTENALDPTVFPSLLKLEQDIIGFAINLLGGGDDAKGTFTSGGTESIILSLKAARDFARVEKGIDHPEIVLPHTAHAAFYKGCHYLGIKPITVDVDPSSFCAIPEAMEAAITDNTILLVGSSPSYAHGVIDPIEEIGQIALKHNLLFHVDACVGGLFLPFAKELGYDIPNFDLSVPGVTSISADFHKYGYAAKGASCVLYNHPKLRQYQIYTCAEWPGYAVVNPAILSSKSGGPMAACWAILNHFGREGYQEKVRACMQASQKIMGEIADIEGLDVLGNPDMNLIGISSSAYNVFEISDRMKQKGWYLQVQLASPSSPANLHLSVNAANVPQVEDMLADLKVCLQEIATEASQADNMDLSNLLPMIQQLPPNQLLNMLEQHLGMSGGEVPENMAQINGLLNLLPAKLRASLLTAYVDRLFG